MPIDFSKPVQTLSGIPVTILTTQGRGDNPVIGYIGEGKQLYFWNFEGDMRGGLNEVKLVNTPETQIDEIDYQTKKNKYKIKIKIVDDKIEDVTYSVDLKAYWRLDNVVAQTVKERSKFDMPRDLYVD